MRKKREKPHSHFTRDERIQLEAYLRIKLSVKDIAELMNRHRSTIYREIKRGSYMKLDSVKWIEYEAYSADKSDERAKRLLKEKGRELKIGNDQKLADFLEKCIYDDGYSPEAALAEAKKQKEGTFKTMICVNTLYSYIDKKIFVRLTNKNLPVKGKRKEKKRHSTVRKKAPSGKSIEKRDKAVLTREEFGHWEMDTVVGKKGKSKKSMLVLTERKTRWEIILLLEEHKADNVVSSLYNLKKCFGDKLKFIFKTITVDNGTEFSNYEGMKKTFEDMNAPLEIYYCHPYSSWERGTNENNNRLIRRKIPKGVCFDDKVQSDIDAICKWINDYPRRSFGFLSSNEMFEIELSKILAA